MAPRKSFFVTLPVNFFVKFNYDCLGTLPNSSRIILDSLTTHYSQHILWVSTIFYINTLIFHGHWQLSYFILHCFAISQYQTFSFHGSLKVSFSMNKNAGDVAILKSGYKMILCLHTAIGEYYFGYFRGFNGGQLSVILINTISTPVNFTIEAPVAGFYYAGVVDGSDETIVYLPFSVAVFRNNKDYKGVYLRADSNAVTVIGQNEINVHSETFLILPYNISSISTEYVYYGISVPGYHSSYQGAILIVGTEDNTSMKLTVTQTATTNTGNTLYTGREYSFVINKLQTFYIRSSSYSSDLTGTKIVTDKQVSVFSGHELTQIPQSTCCNSALIEQVPPVTSWGRVFYTMPLSTRRYYIIKILSSHHSTEIALYCNNFKESYTINEGKYSTKTLSQGEYCVIQSNKPVLVVQFSRGGYDERDYIGDPMMMIIPDVLQFSNRFASTTIQNTTRSGYKHYVNIIVLAKYYQPDMIHLISGGRNISLNTQEWVPIKVGHTTEAYATQVTISEGVADITHVNEDALMTVVIYGFANQGSYGHPGRLDFVGGLFS